MNPQLKQIIREKRARSEPLPAADAARGFKGWYSSKYLPHFDAPGTQQFITYRLADSLPAGRRHEWEAYFKLEDDLEKQRRIEAYIDRGYGACHLRDPRLAGIVQDNLWHHDGRAYRLLAWVIMPNHLHALLETWQTPLGTIVKHLKSYTSKEARKVIKGVESSSFTFWQEDYFDRFVRDEAHFRRVVRYIENNPVKARLVNSPEEWPWSSARYRGQPGEVVPVLTHPTAQRVPLV